jgi:hypothetical protein
MFKSRIIYREIIYPWQCDHMTRKQLLSHACCIGDTPRYTRRRQS